MDPITHVLIAFSLVAWIHKFRKIPYKILVLYLIGSVIPDLDYVFNLLVYFAPIREAERQVKIGNFDFRSPTEVIFHIQDNGLITRIIRPISV